MYDPESNSWTGRAPLNKPRRNFGSAVVGSTIYAIGGVVENWEDTDTIEEYDSLRDVWRIIDARLPSPRACIATVVIDDKIWCIGGSNNTGYLASVDVFDPATGRWEEKPPMLTKRNSLGAAFVDGSIIAIGGFDGKTLSVVERFDISAGRWLRVPREFRPRSNFGICVMDGVVFCAGGMRGTDQIAEVEALDPSSLVLKPIDPLRDARGNLMLLSLGGVLFALGGNNKRFFSTLEIW